MRVMLIVLLLAGFGTQVCADQLGNAADGLAYARAHCAECHGVETSRDDFSPNVDAPDFSVVANTPGMTAAALRVALNSSHRTMPNIILDPVQQRNIIAYILTLKDTD